MLLREYSTNCLEDTIDYRPDTDPLFDRKEAAKYLKIAVGTLAVWDSTGRYDLQPVKLGLRSVRYRKSSLDNFLMQRLTRRRNGKK